MAEAVDTAVRQVWDQQSVWSQAADSAKAAIGRARAFGLTLGIVAAALSTLGSQVMSWQSVPGRALVMLAAISAGLVPLATTWSGPAALREWTRLRSVSEALKSEVCTCLAGAGAYRTGGAGTLLDRAHRILADAGDLAHLTIGLAPRQRPLPDIADVESYAAVRLAGQIRDYYRPRAVLMSRRCAVVRRSELFLAAAAVVLGAVTAAFGVDQPALWVGTITTVSAAVTAHAAAARYAYQELEFSRTAAELDRLLTRWSARQRSDAAADDGFVSRCELVISAQNEAWMAKWAAD
ncbi:DUF4231 domain-containing protein [Streptomyces sp. NPDC004752]